MAFDNVLYIIGNGFDLHHGVKSSYGDFAKWLLKKNRALYYKLSDVCRVDFLWRDFERALANVDRDYFIGMGELMLPEGWTEEDGYAELFYAEDMVRGEAESLWEDIQKWFRKWVNTILWDKCYELQKLWIDYEARFITFNYTPFLETQYGIPAENIVYIHGKKSNNQHPPIIGHDGRDTFDEWWKKAPRSSKRHYKGQHSLLPEVEMMTRSVEEFFSLSEKPIEKIMREHQAFFDDLYDVEHIYVFGHSLGSVDIPYFRAVNNANDFPERLQWNVSYYSEDEKKKLAKAMHRSIMDGRAKLNMMTLGSMQRTNRAKSFF